ncbi:hypothetical protein [Marinobacter salarius]|uniref:Lipoprotein n=1 Tax=Marinobacter salarius TaxID=1420917 RepID=A0A1W6KG05_9GAMM|nr:hypothetical protein [Marinobacter salarius]ARM86347.1 hypothetical protein MARSALSMR5_04330 [Marinobacter salarius]
MYLNDNKPTKSPIVTTAVLAASTLLLAACGGGGGSSSDSGNNGPTIQNEVVNINAAENTTRTVAITGDIKGDISIVRDSSAITLTVDPETNEATVTISEVERAGVDARYEFTTSSDLRYIITVSAENTSAATTVAQTATLTEATGGGDLVRDDLRLAEVALELEYLASQTTYGDKVAAISNNAGTVNIAASDLSTSITTLAQALADYNAGDITDTQLSQTLNATQANFDTLDAAAGDVIDDVLNTINQLVDINLPANIDQTYALEYVPEADRFSRYMNADFGTLESDGNFSFNGPYDFLNSVFTFANSSASK